MTTSTRPTTFSFRRLLAVASIAAAIAALTTGASLHAQPNGVTWRFADVAPIQRPNPCKYGMTLAGFEYDPQGRPVAAWREENNCGGPPDVFWTRQESGVWNNPISIRSGLQYDGTALDGYFGQMILRPSDGNPFFVYRDVAPGNYLNTYESDLGANPFGSNPVFLEPIVGPQTCAYMTYALAFAPGALLPDWVSNFIGCNQYGNIRLDGTILAGVSPAGPSIAITPNGSRHVLWTDGSDAFAYGPAGTTHLFSNVNRAGGETAVVSDASGALHAIVRGVEGDQADWDLGAMVYITSTDDGLTWTPFEYVNPDDDSTPGSIGVSRDISLAVDANGVPAVTYWRWNSELWFAKRDGPDGTWTRSLVTMADPSTRAPRSSQIRFDPAGVPTIAFYDVNARRVRLATPLASGETLPIDIAVTGSVNPAAAQPGESLTYTLNVTNNGAANVDNVLVSNALPAGVTFVDATPAPSAKGTWPLGIVTSGATVTITVHATAPAMPGDIVDTVSVTSDGTDAVPGNNSAAIGATVCTVCGGPQTQGLDVAASVTAVPNPVIANGVVTFIVKATNVGTVDATSVTLVNTLPAGVAVIDAAPSPSSTAGSDQTYAIGALPAGASAWFVIHVQAPLTAATLTDSAHVSASGDVNVANDTASASTVVKPDACFVPTSGLISHWRGDGNAIDDSGTHPGTREGADTYAAGRVGQAFSFNGTDDDIFIANTPDLRPAQFTASAWVRPTTFHGGGWNAAFNGRGGFWLGFANQRPALYTHPSGTLTISPLPAAQNEWYLLTATWDGAVATLYVNGLPVAATAIAEPLIWDEQELFGIGSAWFGGQNQTYERFDGLIDEVTLHNRALSDVEVRGLYDGSSPSCPTPNGAPALTNPGDQTNAEGDTVALPLTASDPDGDALQFSAAGLPTGVAIDPVTGAIAGRIPYGAAGAYPVTVTVSDGTLSSSISFTWTVVHASCSPIAQNDAATTPVGTAVDIRVMDNDIVPAACIVFGAPTIAGVTQPQHGTAVFDNKLGTVTYTPQALFVGTDTFTYTITNTAGDTATATVSVTVTQAVEPAPSTPIRNGDPETGLPFNGVGMILASPTHGACSATLVSRSVVLTAAQCLQDSSPDPVFEFSLGGGRTARLTDIRLHPLFNTVEGTNRAYDVAVAKLDESVTNGWTDVVLPALSDIAPDAGLNGTAVGFGQIDAVSGAAIRTSGVLLMTQYVPDFDLDFNVIPGAYIEVEPGTARDQMFCPAGVGGPLLVQDRIVGVASFRNVATCAASGPGYYINVNRVADWIRATSAELAGTAHHLTLDILGSGSVTGLSSGVCASPECVEMVDTGTVVALTATPAAHFRFSGWEGCDTIAGHTCSVVMDGPKQVVAHFEDRRSVPNAQITLLTPGPIEATGPMTAVPMTAANSTDPLGRTMNFYWGVDDQLYGPSETFTPLLSVGSHLVTLTAIDGFGNNGFTTKVVTVRDRTAPVLTFPPSPYQVAAAALTTPLPNGLVTAVDLVDGNLAVTCTPMVLSLGLNKVHCEATDTSGNRARGIVAVNVTFPALTAAADAVLASTQAARGATPAMLNAASRLVVVVANGNEAGICPAVANYGDAVQAALNRGKISSATASALQQSASAVAQLAGCAP